MTMTASRRNSRTAAAAAAMLAFLTVVLPVNSYVIPPLLGSRRGARYCYSTIVIPSFHHSSSADSRSRLSVSTEESSSSSSSSSSNAASSSTPPPPPPPPPPSSSLPPPILNGKRVLPVQVLMTGLKGHDDRKIAAVYALLGKQYKKGGSSGSGSSSSSEGGWDCVIHVGVSQDFSTSMKAILASNKNNDDDDNVFHHVRALSFSFPEPNSMQEVANQWKNMAVKAGAEFKDIVDPSLFLFDDDDEEDDDDDDWDVEMTAQSMASVMPSTTGPVVIPIEQKGDSNNDDDVIVSPFAKSLDATSKTKDDGGDVAPLTMPAIPATTSSGGLEFTRDEVDIVLNEIRPYLISDGGNATVEFVDESTKTVYLKLLGACGTCPSSTVTMQMGIERVLRENFGNDVSVTQVEDDTNGEAAPTELTMEAVEEEVQRLSAAVIAMGGVVRIVNVDSSTGVVQLEFRGANKVQKGLELALLDLPFCNAVQFVMPEDEF